MEGTVKDFDKSKKADLSQVKKNEKACLISKYDSHFKPDEQVYDDFISRREFINHTGVYVSASYFNIVYDKFKESGLSIDEFVGTFSSNPMIQEVNLSGTFKYIVDDDTVNGLGTYDDTHEPNIWEIVNSIDMEMFHKWLESGRSIVRIMKIFKDYDKEISHIMDGIKSTTSDIGDIVEAHRKALTLLD
jgi:hypothetical protein